MRSGIDHKKCRMFAPKKPCFYDCLSQLKTQLLQKYIVLYALCTNTMLHICIFLQSPSPRRAWIEITGYSASGKTFERCHIRFIIAVRAVSINDGLEFLPTLADGNEGFSVKAYAVIFNGNFLRPVFVFLFADRFRHADIVIKTNSRDYRQSSDCADGCH